MPGSDRSHSQHSAIAVVAMISSSRGLFEDASERLAETLGPRVSMCEIFPFDFTDYYDEEMGKGLLRTYAIFECNAAEDELRRLKRVAGSLEAEFLCPGTKNRRVNLDPGVLTADHLVLASHKYAAHRIYMGDGVYAELELIYRNGHFQPLPWTYPDYGTRIARDFFKAARSSLLPERQTRS